MSDSKQWPPPLDPARADSIRDAVFADIARRSSPRFRRRRRLVVVLAALIALILLGAGTATAILRFAAPDKANLGYCSPAATTEHSVWGPYAFGAVTDTHGRFAPLAAVDTCRAMWTAGIVAHPDGTHTVPASFAACIVDGMLVVMPGDNRTCLRLGIPDALTTN
jgi:hypothetical protein